MNFVFEYRRVVIGWEGFGLESFRNNTSLSLSIYYIFDYFQKDLSMNYFYSNSTLRHSNTRFTPLKLTYIVSVCADTCLYVCKYTHVIPEEFEAESFPHKYNPTYSNAKSTLLNLIYIISSK